MVRPGSVIPMGAADSRTDYDFADGVTLHAFALADGQTATVRIPDLRGRTCATFQLTRDGGQLRVETDSKKSWQVELHGMDGVRLAR